MICGTSQLSKTTTQRNQCKTKFTRFLVFNKGFCIKPHRGKSPFAFFSSGWIPGWLLSRFHSDESLKGKDERSFPLDCNLFIIVEMHLAPIPLNAAGKPPIDRMSYLSPGEGKAGQASFIYTFLLIVFIKSNLVTRIDCDVKDHANH